MKVVTTNTIDPALWDNFVAKHPLGTIYHHSLWQDVIKKTYGYQPLYHLIFDEHSNLQAAVSSAVVKSWLTGNRIISYPFSDMCDPLVETSEQLEALLKALERSRAELNARFVELRLAKAHRFVPHSSNHHEYSDYILPLDRDPNALFQSFHKNCIQRAINKAQKQELEILTGKTEKDLQAFYRLHLMTRKKHGVPIQPYGFFRNLWNSLTVKGMLSLILARHQEKVVGGMIVLWFNATAYYKFGASDERFMHLRANQLLMWEAIQLAQEKACHMFDFGRASSTSNGLAEYKSRWGTHKIPLPYLQLPKGRKSEALIESSTRHASLKKIMARMPSLINRISGKLLYRHFA